MELINAIIVEFERNLERIGVLQVFKNMGSHFKNCHKRRARLNERALFSARSNEWHSKENARA